MEVRDKRILLCLHNLHMTIQNRVSQGTHCTVLQNNKLTIYFRSIFAVFTRKIYSSPFILIFGF